MNFMRLIEKTSSDAIGRGYGRGEVSEDSWAEAARKLKLKPRKIKTLGQGGEGVANLMTDPDHGVAVWKGHDPTSRFYSKGHFDAKAEVFRKAQGSQEYGKYFTDYYGSHPVYPVLKTKYQPVLTSSVDMGAVDGAGKYIYKELPRGALEKGLGIRDLSVSNYGYEGTTPKLFDFLSEDGMKQTEQRNNLRYEETYKPERVGTMNVPPNTKEQRIFNYNRNTGKFNPKHMATQRVGRPKYYNYLKLVEDVDSNKNYSTSASIIPTESGEYRGTSGGTRALSLPQAKQSPTPQQPPFIKKDIGGSGVALKGREWLSGAMRNSKGIKNKFKIPWSYLRKMPR